MLLLWPLFLCTLSPLSLWLSRTRDKGEGIGFNLVLCTLRPQKGFYMSAFITSPHKVSICSHSAADSCSAAVRYRSQIVVIELTEKCTPAIHAILFPSVCIHISVFWSSGHIRQQILIGSYKPLISAQRKPTGKINK